MELLLLGQKLLSIEGNFPAGARGVGCRTFYSDFNTVFVPLLLLTAGVGFPLLVFEEENVLFAEIQPIHDSPSQR